MPVFRRRAELDFPVEEVFAWHTRPGAFERLTPPWESVRVLERSGGMSDGGRVLLGLRKGPAELKWEVRHTEYEENRLFKDEQVSGPFNKWIHAHRFLPREDGGSVMEDEVEWEAPLGSLGRVFGGGFIESTLRSLFAFRHHRLANDLARHRAYGERPLTVAVSGSSGLIGSALVDYLRSGGHAIRRLVRRQPRPENGDVYWNLRTGEVDADALEGVDAVVHLAGEPLAGVRWTPDKKKAIRESRTRATELLATTLAGLRHPPGVLVSSSAIGYYGDRGDTVVTEKSAAGKGFLAQVCRAWEAATEPARRAGIRVVLLRTGMALSPAGGALGTMLLPFKLGVGGRLGSGRQYVSWIDLDDLTGLIHHGIVRDEVSGPVNATSPHPVPNATFATTLGRVLGRPTILPVPALALKALFGEMGKALLLEGARVVPNEAERTGFEFLLPGLEESLRFQLGREDEGEGRSS